jgi:Potential Queuosine, Q, salvage protein family
MASSAIRNIELSGIIHERTMGTLDSVRANAASVAASASFVTVDDAAIEAYARSVPLALAKPPELDPATHYLGDQASTLAYVVTLDAINFGSGYFPHLRKRPGLSGYFTVASALKDRFEEAGPLSPYELQRLSAEACSVMFGQAEPDAAVEELMALFARALNDLGRLVATRYGGDFRAMVDAADGSAGALVGILAEMPFYQDVGFYKRAQLTAADLSVARVAHFGDLDQLTIFADNLVPHVLRVDGVLRYDPELLGRINREELIPSGSREELEIRACAVHAVELIKAQLDGVTSMQLDYVLWNRGQAPAYKAQPRHRTRTVFY